MKKKFKNNEQLREMAEILSRHWMTKPEILKLFNLKTERAVRRNVELIANKVPVISTSTIAGYKVATEEDSTALIELADKELELKIKALQARRRPLIRELKRRKEINEKGE